MSWFLAPGSLFLVPCPLFLAPCSTPTKANYRAKVAKNQHLGKFFQKNVCENAENDVFEHILLFFVRMRLHM